MGFLQKITNIFGDNQVSESPDARADFFDILDQQRDHNYWQAKIHGVLRAMSKMPNTEPMIFQGGGVSDAGSGQVNLAEGWALGQEESTGEPRFIFRSAISGITLPTDFDDGRTVWVISEYKRRLDTPERAHRKLSPTEYKFIEIDSFPGDPANSESSDLLFVDAAPTAGVVIWGIFTMTGTIFVNLGGSSVIWEPINSVNRIDDLLDVDDSGTKKSGDILSWNEILNKYLRTSEVNSGIGITGAYKNFVMNPNGEIRQRIRHVIPSNFSQAIDGTYTIDGWIGLNDDGSTISGIGYDSVSHSIQFSHNDGGAHRTGILHWFEHNDIKSLIGRSGTRMSLRVKVRNIGGVGTETIRAALIEFTGSIPDEPFADPISAWGAVPALLADHNFADSNKFKELSVVTGASEVEIILDNIAITSSTTLKNLGIIIWTPNPIISATPDSFRWFVRNVQVNLGIKALSYSDPESGSDKVRALRRFQVIGGQESTNLSNVAIAHGGSDAATFARFFVSYFPKRKGGNVSLTFPDAAASYTMFNEGPGLVAVNSFLSAVTSHESATFVADRTGSWPAGEVDNQITMFGSNGADAAGRIFIDADIGV